MGSRRQAVVLAVSVDEEVGEADVHIGQMVGGGEVGAVHFGTHEVEMLGGGSHPDEVHAGPGDDYAQLGLQLTYDPASNQVRAEVDLARGPGGVGGGT